MPSECLQCLRSSAGSVILADGHLRGPGVVVDPEETVGSQRQLLDLSGISEGLACTIVKGEGVDVTAVVHPIQSAVVSECVCVCVCVRACVCVCVY